MNPKIYSYAYVKGTKKVYEELFNVRIEKSKSNIQVILKPRKRIKEAELFDYGYEFFNCILGVMKQIKTSM